MEKEIYDSQVMEFDTSDGRRGGVRRGCSKKGSGFC